MTPLIDRFAKNRLTYLLGTGSAHCAVVLVESQTIRVKRQPAVREEPADFRLGVRYHGLVEHSAHATGQDSVVVGHDLDVVPIVTTDVREPVAEPLAARKVLLEA